MEDGGKKHVEMLRIDSALMGAFELVTSLAERGPKTKRRRKQLCVPTGFHNIDQHIGGLWPGELAVVTGGPGVGKSSFAANLALSAAKQGVRVLLAALGTSATETTVRMCAADGRISIGDVLSGTISGDDWGALTESSNRLAELDMYICDDGGLTLDGLASMARSVANGEKRALVVIDGIELTTVPDGDRVLNRPHTTGNTATFLKKLAREIDAPILATMDYGAGKWCSDVKCYADVFRALPGGAESAADSILCISRHLTSENTGSIPSNVIAEVVLAKSRFCEPIETKLVFVPKYMRFMDYVDWD